MVVIVQGNMLKKQDSNIGLPEVARQGRTLQRYSANGGRLIVGCVPYRLKEARGIDGPVEHVVELLVISSQKGHGIMFPKGGWEIDETEKQAAAREAMEEAGVLGNVEVSLGNWTYNSKRYGIAYEVIMFPLNVTDVLELWPEIDLRKRSWVTVEEALKECQHTWMKEALQRLLLRLSNSRRTIFDS